MRSETELLILCASPVRSAQNLARIRELLDGPLDWAFLQELADCQRVAPLLCWTLLELRRTDVPRPLADDFHASARKSLLLTGELVRALNVLERGGVKAVPFKGPALALAAFDNLALRSFDDLDFLVARADVRRARDILLAAGYTELIALGEAREEALLNAYDELTLVGRGGFPLLELHWSFLAPHYSVALDVGSVLARCGSVSLGDHSIPSLGLEDLLLVLALHAAKHSWSALRPVCDIAWLMSKRELDWGVILREARRLRVVRILLLAVTLVDRIFGVPIPSMLTGPCAGDRRVTGLADRIMGAMFGKQHDETEALSSALLYIAMREDPRDRLSFMLRLALRPAMAELETFDLPRGLHFLYPVLRVPRMIRKYWFAG